MATTADARHAAARRHLQDGAYEAALPILEALLEGAPDDADLLNDAALAHAYLGAHKQARTYLEHALDHTPTHLAAFSNLIDLLLEHTPMDAFAAYEQHAARITASTTKSKLRGRIIRQAGMRPEENGPSASDDLPGTSFKHQRVAVVAASDQEGNPQRKLRWGDHWFKKHLQVALSRLGVSVVNHQPDVIIHLFGAPVGELPDEAFKVLWIHSHPDWISPRLLAQYDQIYCLSPSFTERLRSWGFAAEVLLGASAFTPPERQLEAAPDVVFVGNAKGKKGRRIIHDLQSTPHEAAIWGEGWEGIVPAHWIRGDYYPNEQLNALYASAKVVLNDHHPDMRFEGFIGNRIFDVLACGGLVVSDPVRSLPSALEEAVFTYGSADELDAILNRCLTLSPGKRSRLDESQDVIDRFSFEAVARTILTSLPERLEHPTPFAATNGRAAEPVSAALQGSAHASQPVMVMGMHRSGTSLMTQLLHRAGVYAGSTCDHIPPASDNPEGFWELRSLVELNKIILFLAGGNWSKPPAEEDVLSVSVGPRARHVFSYFDGVPTWVIKDPRLCLTLPVLQEALPDSLKIIRMYRNPASIAKSLQKRNLLPQANGERLIHLYVNRMEKYTDSFECIDIQFEDIFLKDPSCVIDELEKILGPGYKFSQALDLVVNPDLRHH